MYPTRRTLHLVDFTGRDEDREHGARRRALQVLVLLEELQHDARSNHASHTALRWHTTVIFPWS